MSRSWLLSLGVAWTSVAMGFHASSALAAAAGPPPLSHEEIKNVVDSHLADLKACIGQQGSATGKLVVEFGILSNGKVTDAKIKERSSNAGLDICITQAFGRWTFPKPHGGVTMGVDYPFVFSEPPPPPQGKLSDQQMADTVHSHKAETDVCLQNALKAKSGDKPEINGTVVIGMVIDPSGKVTEATIRQNSTGSNVLDTCILTQVQTWLFPKPVPAGEFAVAYPFIFGKK
jgi:TonB family protein